MAESIGAWLAKSELQPGARVAILADNHPRWVAAFLGVVAAGCTAVPLDTALHAGPDRDVAEGQRQFAVVLRRETSGDCG